MLKKVCSRCGQSKDSSSFSINRAMKSGLSSYCIPCTKERAGQRAMSKSVESKMCASCRIEKAAKEFPVQRSSSDGLRSDCKECRNKRRKLDNSLRYMEIKPCRKCHRDLPREAYFLNKNSKVGVERTCIECRRAARFQVTREAIHDIRVKQNGKCQCCRKALPFNKECIDHNHSTGRVRGILCSRCNTALGLAGDSIATLESMIEYLEADLAYMREQDELLVRED